MRIDIKEIQNLLYRCNVNKYDMIMETEHETITITMTQPIETIDMEELTSELEEIFYEVEFQEYDDYTSLWLSYHDEWDE